MVLSSLCRGKCQKNTAVARTASLVQERGGRADFTPTPHLQQRAQPDFLPLTHPERPRRGHLAGQPLPLSLSDKAAWNDFCGTVVPAVLSVLAMTLWLPERELPACSKFSATSGWSLRQERAGSWLPLDYKSLEVRQQVGHSAARLFSPLGSNPGPSTQQPHRSP